MVLPFYVYNIAYLAMGRKKKVITIVFFRTELPVIPEKS